MADSVNNISSDNLAATGAYSKYNTSVIDTNGDDKESSYMDFSSYLELLAAQMSNQDFNDPMSDSEFLQQMASYSMLESINSMTQQSNISYATSLVGKAVTVCTNGVYDTGIVDSVMVNDNKYYLVLNGNSYETKTVTDVTSSDTFTKVKDLIGKTVTVDDAGSDVTGKVTNVIITGGNSFAVLESGEAYLVSKIKNVKDSTTTADTTASTSSETSGTAEAESSDAQSYLSSLSLNEEAGVFQAKSAAIYNQLWASLDSVASQDDDSLSAQSNGASLSDGSGSTNSAQSLSVQGNFTGDNSDYAALLNSDSDELYTMTSEVVASDALAGANADYNILNVLQSDTAANENLLNTTAASTRKYADEYPEEAALADELGTKMVDIKFIHNNAITSKIDTSEILGYTKSGKAFTEIGFSGKGRLGEVVTWSDGTQRVEIINADGTSGHFTTSGNYTLDQICDFNCEPGSLTGKLTPFESAIRHYAREYTEEEQARLDSFSNYLKNNS